MSEGYTPAVLALTKLHAELGGRLKENAKAAVKLRADMKHVEAVLHLLQPGFNARRIASRRKYNPNPLFRRGTIFRAVLDALRASPEPMTVDAIVEALFSVKGVAEPARDQRRHLYGAVNASLDNHLGTTVANDDGRPRRWRIRSPSE